MIPRMPLRISALAVRAIVLAPALLRLTHTLEAFSNPAAWLRPMKTFWYFPAINGVFSLLCLLPYPTVLFTKPLVRVVLLSLQVTILALLLRFEFLPFHYAAPDLQQYPEYAQEFQKAAQHKTGTGFQSEREIE